MGILLTSFSSCSVKSGKDNQMKSAVIGSDTSEIYRPSIHFTPENNWMNDPNGLFYNDGVYHLYFQYYPQGNTWGPMHWGHSSSRDLVNWEEHNIAIYPDKDRGYIFSGSIILDSNNVSGLGLEEQPPIVAMYTHHDPNTNEQSQSISFSVDGGMTFKSYERNPVISNPNIKDFRDPKVVWDGSKWICAVTVGQGIAFYGSKDLLNWDKLSEFKHEEGSKTGVWECPDLMFFDGAWDKAVLIVSVGDLAPNGGSGTQYFTGIWDGTSFKTVQKNLKWLDLGRDNYAGVTWHNAPSVNSEKLFLGWMSNWKYATLVPTYKWRSSMTFPRNLEYKNLFGESYLVQKPHPNILKLRSREEQIKPETFIQGANTMEWSFDGSEPWSIVFTNVHGDTLKISSDRDSIYIDRSKSGKVIFENSFTQIQSAPKKKNSDQSVRLIMDVMSVELFCEGGLTTMTSLVFPNAPFSVAFVEGIEGSYYYLHK
jgi:sucrose-6-phosphate hydrolase SacC (GH32 family)